MTSNNLRILVVEDNPADAFLIQEALRKHDSSGQTLAISNGDIAIRYLAENTPDLVVLDLNIPGRDGVEILQFIREQLRLSKVVVVIFSSSPIDAIERKAPEADAHLQKPFDLDEFLAVGQKIFSCYERVRAASAQ
jgi:CheY-like chemotaxis protein